MLRSRVLPAASSTPTTSPSDPPAPREGRTIGADSQQTSRNEAETLPVTALTDTPPEASLLVVEDEPNIRELLATSLRFAGFEVSSAADGSSALRLAKEAADGKDVRLGGGATTIRQFLDAGLIDTLRAYIDGKTVTLNPPPQTRARS